MSITPKKLCQSVIATSMAAVYTVPASTITQVTEIWITNTNVTTARVVSLAVHGTAAGNTILAPLSLAANETKVISNCRIVLSATEPLAAKVDAGSDVNIAAYGIEEV